MAKKFQNKYRTESNRLKGWDYSGNGYYFYTIVTYERQYLFGEIKNGGMILSNFGGIAYAEWYKSFEIRQELILDEFVMMPNHLHAIVVIDKNDMNCTTDNKQTNVEKRTIDEKRTNRRDARPCVSTSHRKPKPISSFVAGYKSAVINLIDDFIDDFEKIHGHILQPKFNKHNPLWQSNYNDHIIRNDNSYHRIKSYIRSNPEKWEDDKFNPDNK